MGKLKVLLLTNMKIYDTEKNNSGTYISSPKFQIESLEINCLNLLNHQINFSSKIKLTQFQIHQTTHSIKKNLIIMLSSLRNQQLINIVYPEK